MALICRPCKVNRKRVCYNMFCKKGKIGKSIELKYSLMRFKYKIKKLLLDIKYGVFK